MENSKTSQTSQDLNKEKWVDKIIKLLSLASSSNEHEAQVAMLKAQELMVKHNIEMSDVQNIDTQEKEVVTGKVGECVVSRWKIDLAVIVANNFKCKIFLSSVWKKRGHVVTFLGLKEDVEICKAMYTFVLKVAEKGMDKAYLAISNNLTNSAKGAKGDYVVGFMKGLRDKFEEQKSKNDWGLVLVVDKAVIEKFDNMSFQKNTSTASIKTGGYSEATSMGYKDGKSCSFGTQLTGK